MLPSGGSTLLHIVSMANIPTAVKNLLKRGVKVDEKDGFGQQAIHYAARGGATEVSKILIKSTRSVINAEDNNFITPLQMAARHYKGDIMRLLIMKGAKAKCLNEEGSRKLKEARRDVEKTISHLLEDAAKFNVQSLQSAAANGDLRAVQLLLAEGTDVNAQYGEYDYALVAAAHNGHDAVVVVLLQKGATINARGGMYGCALVAAAKNGHKETVKVLLQAGADISAQGGIYANALVAAARFGQKEVVNILLKGGANINTRYGVSVLAIALESGREAEAMLLVEACADTNLLRGLFAYALAVAARRNYVAVVQALLNATPECDSFLAAMVNLDQSTILRSLGVVLLVATWMGRLDIVEQILAFNEKDSPLRRAIGDMSFLMISGERLKAMGSMEIAQYNGYTALQISAAAGHSRMVARFLIAGANVEYAPASSGGRTALQLAAEHGHVEIVERLLAAGADPHVECDKTALQAAVQHGHLRIVKTLLAAGAYVDASNYGYGGATGLQEAAEHGHLEIVKYLLACGANVNASNSRYGATALQVAVQHAHYKIVEVLLAYRADPNATANRLNDYTALQIAVNIGNLEMVTILLGAGAHVNAAGPIHGRGTALHKAAWAGHRDIVARLIAAGADVNILAFGGYTALERAITAGQLEVADLLRQAGAKDIPRPYMTGIYFP